MSTPTPQVRGRIDAHAQGVALFLHGGTDDGRYDNSWRRPAVLRMIPFARAVRRAGRGRIATLRLRNAYYGWSKDFSEPIADALWAVQNLRAQVPDLPIALVGHSGGGRVALRLADRPGVTTVVGLAPWVVEGDERVTAATKVLLAHGTNDTITTPRLTEELADRLRHRGVDVRLDLRPDTHSLLRKAAHWHRACAGFVSDSLLGGGR